MTQQKQQVLVWICGTFFVLVNLIAFGLTYQRRQVEASVNRYLREVRGRQGQVLASWHSDVSLPLQSEACRQRLAALTSSETFEVPERASRVAFAELDPIAACDLQSAMVGLVRAYQKGTADALLGYMQARGETISTTSIERMHAYLVDQYGLNASDLQSLSPADLLNRFWQVVHINPGWEALVPGDSSLNIWRISAISAEELSAPQHLAKSDEKLWMRKAHIYHNFKSVEDSGLAEELARSGEVTVADLRIVIKHQGLSAHSICPYVVRFWYDTLQQKWAPHLMLQFRTSRDIPVRMLF